MRRAGRQCDRTGVAEAGLWTWEDGGKAMEAAHLQDQDGARVGVVITGRMSAAPFLQAHSAHGDVAPIFAALRQRAAFEARECLAHEIHDGIAQELVGLGYRIDSPAAMLRSPLPSSRWHSTGCAWI
jgi:hypothetical protein